MENQQSFDDLNQQNKRLQLEVESLIMKKDAFYHASCLSDEATCYLDHAESMLQLLIDSYFNGASAEDFNGKWGIEYAYKIIQDTLYAISWKVARANAMLHAGMGTEHGYLQGMKISVKEMEDTIKRVNALKERKE